MARKRVLKTGVLNIKTHPHSPKKYIDLFRATYRRGRPGKIRGSDWGIIGTFRKKDIYDDEIILFGTIYRFLEIDPLGDWLNLKNRTPVNVEEDGGPPPVPDYLKPNLKESFYIFYPESHRLFFDAKAITPGSMRKLMQSIFSDQKIFEKFGQVDVEVQSTREAINRILKIPRITKLNIQFSFPNPDEMSEATKKVYKRFKKRNILKHDQTSTSRHEEGIKSDEDLKAMLDIARSNGAATATGYDGKTKIVRSTKDHPMFGAIKYDPDVESVFEAMLYSSTGMLNRIRG